MSAKCLVKICVHLPDVRSQMGREDCLALYRSFRVAVNSVQSCVMSYRSLAEVRSRMKALNHTRFQSSNDASSLRDTAFVSILPYTVVKAGLQQCESYEKRKHLQGLLHALRQRLSQLLPMGAKSLPVLVCRSMVRSCRTRRRN